MAKKPTDLERLEQQVESFRDRIAELEDLVKRMKTVLGSMGQTV